MSTIIETNEYNEIHTIMCPECKSHLEEDAFVNFNCYFNDSDDKVDIENWTSIECPTNRGMIACESCNYKFIIDPYKPPKMISQDEIKIKYPQHDSVQNREYWSDYKDRGYDTEDIQCREIYLAKINKCITWDESFITLDPLPNDVLMDKRFNLCPVNTGYGCNCDMYNEASSTYFRCVSQNGEKFDYEYYHD